MRALRGFLDAFLLLQSQKLMHFAVKAHSAVGTRTAELSPTEYRRETVDIKFCSENNKDDIAVDDKY